MVKPGTVGVTKASVALPSTFVGNDVAKLAYVGVVATTAGGLYRVPDPASGALVGTLSSVSINSVAVNAGGDKLVAGAAGGNKVYRVAIPATASAATVSSDQQGRWSQHCRHQHLGCLRRHHRRGRLQRALTAPSPRQPTMARTSATSPWLTAYSRRRTSPSRRTAARSTWSPTVARAQRCCQPVEEDDRLGQRPLPGRPDATRLRRPHGPGELGRRLPRREAAATERTAPCGTATMAARPPGPRWTLAMSVVDMDVEARRSSGWWRRRHRVQVHRLRLLLRHRRSGQGPRLRLLT